MYIYIYIWANYFYNHEFSDGPTSQLEPDQFSEIPSSAHPQLLGLTAAQEEKYYKAYPMGNATSPPHLPAVNVKARENSAEAFWREPGNSVGMIFEVKLWHVFEVDHRFC